MTAREDKVKIVEDGRTAWGRIKEGATWNDWVAVGRALVIGRDTAMKAACTDRPIGAVYSRAFSEWLRENKLDGIDKTTRSQLMTCLDNLEEIEAWRATLTTNQRMEINHPSTVVRRWPNGSKPTSGVFRPNKETLREANMRLTEEVDELRREKFSSPEAHARLCFETYSEADFEVLYERMGALRRQRNP